VLAATVAGLLLVGVGVVSARAARRRLRYGTWYCLHFYLPTLRSRSGSATSSPTVPSS